ncbi:MAG: hypothetical protein K0S33_1753 [Bacteroidetes bacterium]|jgi:hypothetical protein|nr:hypothetical protein [Bacteroidota bacterium]
MELKEIEGALIAEGFEVRSNTIDIEGIAVPTLTVLIELEGKEKKQGIDLELMFVPGIDDQLEGCHILQCFIVLADSIDSYAPEKREELAAALSAFNMNLPLGAYGVLDQDQLFYYKHMIMMPSEMNEATKASLIQSIWMVCFVQNQCYPIIETILDKEMA